MIPVRKTTVPSFLSANSLWLALVTLTVIFTPGLSQAYKLRLHTVVDKMIKNNGRPGSSYKVDREVLFEYRGQTVKAKEEWWVKDSNRMKVKVSSLESSSPWSFEITYNGQNRQTVSSSREVKSYRNSPEFFEPLFFERSKMAMLKRMEQYRFIPSWAKTIPAPNYVGGKTIMKDESFVGLAPSQGSVNYTFGAASTTSGGQGSTFLFVEQDSWRITKGQLNSTSEFRNQQFQAVEGDLQLPGVQVIRWDDRAAHLRLISAKKTKVTEADLTLNTQSRLNLPNSQVIKEFYSRFR